MYQTSTDLIAVQALIAIKQDELTLAGMTFYSATSAKTRITVGDGVAIFHAIMDEARDHGFAYCTVEAYTPALAKLFGSLNSHRQHQISCMIHLHPPTKKHSSKTPANSHVKHANHLTPSFQTK